MVIEKNDVDLICVRDYIVGLGWALLSIFGAFVSFWFDNLKIAIMIKHAPGFGLGQLAAGIICLISLFASLLYIYDTWEKQKYLGKS